jgi:hypothetical protein
MNRIIPAPEFIFVVQAHAMSGPPAVVIRPFLRKQEAAAFAGQLAQRVRGPVASRRFGEMPGRIPRARTEIPDSSTAQFPAARTMWQPSGIGNPHSKAMSSP